MPNIGKPSLGCRSCKERKVKCDQTLPGCLRCFRNSRECPGYPTASDVTFRNTLSTEVQKRQRILPGSGGSMAIASQKLAISKPMATDWRAQAVSFFFNDYVVMSSESTVGFGFLQCLPDIWSKSPEAAAYQEAVSAVALASFAHRSSLDYLVVQARQRYGKALQLSNATLQKSAEVGKDSTLATVLCLGIYELITGEKPPWRTDWSSHIDILEYLLHVRRLAPHESAESRQLSTNAHIVLQTRNLSKRLRPSKDAAMIVNDPRKEESIRQHGNLVCETCNYLASADETLRLIPSLVPSHETDLRLGDLVSEGFEIDRKLERWSEQVSGRYIYTAMEAPDCSLSEMQSPSQRRPSIHIYSSGAMAYLWNLHRCTRIFLLQCIQDCVRRQKHISQLQQPLRIYADEAELEDKLSVLYDGICASVPYLLGEIDQQGRLQPPRHGKAVGGFFLLWPLRLLLFRGPSDEAQRAWIKKQLAYIRTNMGIHQATDPWRYEV
ncbi:MAG: hypothetical protein Q9195_006440 [Heterodermia aff. obscurata]